MNLVLYLTNRIKYKWPKEYADEFVRKLTDRGHNISVISDDTDEQKAKNVIYACIFFSCFCFSTPFLSFPPLFSSFTQIPLFL